MRVHLIKRQSLVSYIENNSQSKTPLKNWLSIVKYANWIRPQDIVSSFGSADILGQGSERVVFNIGGNKYRMICKYHFGNKKVKWLGTHSAYSQLCKVNLQYTIDSFK